MGNYEELKKEFLLIREDFYKCGENSKSTFQEYINRLLAQKTPEEAQAIADIILECINEDIEKADTLIHEVQSRKVSPLLN